MKRLRQGGAVSKSGKIYSDKADQILSASLDPSKRREAVARKPEKSAPSSEINPELLNKIGSLGADELLRMAGTISESQARTILTLIRARDKQLSCEKKLGRFLDVDEVKRVAFTAARRTRDAVLNVPSRISDKLAVMTDPFEVEQYLTAELKEALRESTTNADA